MGHWLLSRRDEQGNDTQVTLETMGFIILGIHDDLFYDVQPPVGWSRSEHGFREDIHDNSGTKRIENYPIIWESDNISIRDAFLKLA